VTKKAATAKTTGETEVDYRLSASACRPVSKLYGFGTNDKYAVSFDTEGTTDFCLVSFFVSGVLPETGGFVATLSDDGYTIRWSRPVDGFLFSMEHLKSVMGADYSDTHVRVRSFDKVTQAIAKDLVKVDANGLVQVKAQLAEQRKTAKKRAAKTRPLELYEATSSQETTTTPSPNVRRRRNHGDWATSRPARGSRVSEENEEQHAEEESEAEY